MHQVPCMQGLWWSCGSQWRGIARKGVLGKKQDETGCFAEIEVHGTCMRWSACVPCRCAMKSLIEDCAGLQMIELGRYEIDTWYWSPYPEPFASQEKLYVCEYCLKYFRKRKTLVHHMAKCTEYHPPGDEIYRSAPPSKNRADDGPDVVDPPIAVFEVGHYLLSCHPERRAFDIFGSSHVVFLQKTCWLGSLRKRRGPDKGCTGCVSPHPHFFFHALGCLSKCCCCS